MKKAIKITQQNIDNNQHLFKGKNVNDIVIYTQNNFPKVFNNASVNFNSNLPEFLNVVEPTLTESQQIDNNLENGIVEAGTFTYAVKEISEPTAQELYDALIEEGKQVFQQFTTDLAEATLPRLIAGSVPSELQQLSAVLQTTKTRINNGLKLMLDNNMLEELKSFSYQTDEAEQLRQAIESFK